VDKVASVVQAILPWFGPRHPSALQIAAAVETVLQ